MAKKAPQNFTLDKDIIAKIEEQSKDEERSKSFIVNRILKSYYSKIKDK